MRRTTFALLILFVATSAFSQQPATGFPQYGSFSPLGFDTVNNQNLNVNFGIPIVSSPGRGMDFNLGLVYDSSVWRRNGSVWSPVVDQNGNATFGWKKDVPIGRIEYELITELCEGAGGEIVGSYFHFVNWRYTDVRGTVRTFPLDVFDYRDSGCGVNNVQGTLTGYAYDNSGHYMDATEPWSPIMKSPAGDVVNGTLTDTNGNYISQIVVSGSETDWKDTLGRITLKIITSGNTVSYKILDQNNTYQTATLTSTSYNIKTNFTCTGVTNYTGTANLPTSLALPNGQSFSFTYEDTPGFSGYKTGRLKRVTLPTGGYYEYIYPTTGSGGLNCADGTGINLTRNVNDGTTTNAWLFSRAQSGSNWVTTLTPPTLSYDTAGNDSVYTFNSGGQLTTQQVYQGSSGTSSNLRLTVNTTYAANGSPASSTRILEDNSKQSKVETTFDNYGNLSEMREYDWGTGAPGAVTRTTQYTYLSTSPYTSRNIWNRPTQILVRSGGPTGTIKSRTDIAYDAGSLTCVTGAAQHDDGAFGCSFATRGNPTSTTVYTNAATPSGGITKSFTYDSVGNLRTADADCCNKIKWSFTSTYQYAYPQTVTVGASGGPQTSTSATYNSYTGQIASSTDENNVLTSYVYDAVTKRLTSVTTASKIISSYTYDDTNRKVTLDSIVDGTNKRRTVTYADPLGRGYRQSVGDTSNNFFSNVDLAFDTLGRAYKTSTPYTTSASYWTETRFDGLGRPTTVLPPDYSGSGTNKTTYQYTLSTATVTDPAQMSRKFDYDGLGRLTTVFEPDVNNGNSLTVQTAYSYNMGDALTSVTQGSQTRTYNYDDAGRLVSTALPESGITGYQYNSFNQVMWRIDARSVGTQYTYDTMNRPYQVIYNVGATGVPATATVTYTFGTSTVNYRKGRLWVVSDGTNSSTYTYDAFGRVTDVQQKIGATTYPVSYTYNDAGQVRNITYPSNKQITQNYDSTGRIQSVSDGTNTLASGFGFNAAEQITNFIYGNGVVANLTYTPERLQLNTLTYSKIGVNIFKLTYGYTQNSGNNGQITQITDNMDSGRTVNYTYDALARLSTAVTTGSANYPKWGLTYTYDRYGNKTQQSNPNQYGNPPTYSLAVDPATNRIIGLPHAYDANGNMTNDGVNSALTYDAENRLVSANGTATYTFDPNSLRIKRTYSGTTTNYVYSGTQVIAEYEGGTVKREYVYGGLNLLAAYDNGSTTPRYVHPDHLSTRFETNTSGTDVRDVGHYPFGENWYDSASGNSTAKWKFTSYERDAETNLDYAIMRNDLPRYGRFLQTDQLAGNVLSPQSQNRFAYTHNVPINHIDPLGLDDEILPLPWGGTCRVDGWTAPCSMAVNLVKGDGGFSCPGNIYYGTNQDNLPTQCAGYSGGTSAFLGCIASGTWDSRDSAVLAAYHCALPASIASNSEFGGNFYRISSSGQFSFTIPRVGSFSGGGGQFWIDPSDVPGGTTFAGDYHTHGSYYPSSYDPDYQEHFSVDDIGSNLHFNQGNPSYLFTPAGRILMFDPSRWPTPLPSGCVWLGTPVNLLNTVSPVIPRCF